MKSFINGFFGIIGGLAVMGLAIKAQDSWAKVDEIYEVLKKDREKRMVGRLKNKL